MPCGGTHADAAAQPGCNEASEVGLEPPQTDPDVIAGMLTSSPRSLATDRAFDTLGNQLETTSAPYVTELPRIDDRPAVVGAG